MSQNAISFFFSNYDFKNFKEVAADQGFIENHINSLYAEDEKATVSHVRRMIRELSVYPDLRTDFYFDFGGVEGYYRRLEGYRIHLGDKEILKITIEQGEDAGTYELAPVAVTMFAGMADQYRGKRFTQTDGIDYMYLFSQLRNLMTFLSSGCLFKVEKDDSSVSLTIMPITNGLGALMQPNAKVAQKAAQPTGTGTFIKLRLQNP